MNAIEFESLPKEGHIRVPREVPEGVRLRVLLLWDQPEMPDGDLKSLFVSTTEGLTEEDLDRPRDFGRDHQWDT